MTIITELLERNKLRWTDSPSPGCILIDGRFVYSPNTGRWRVEGKSKWYFSKSFEDFLENYVINPRPKLQPLRLEDEIGDRYTLLGKRFYWNGHEIDFKRIPFERARYMLEIKHELEKERVANRQQLQDKSA